MPLSVDCITTTCSDCVSKFSCAPLATIRALPLIANRPKNNDCIRLYGTVHVSRVSTFAVALCNDAVAVRLTDVFVNRV